VSVALSVSAAALEAVLGLNAQDLVPASLRAEWRQLGYYPGRDVFGSFEDHALADPDKPAVVDDSGTVRYAGLAAAARRVANRLADAGVWPGDVVAVQVPDSWQMCAAQLGVTAVGAVCLPCPMAAWKPEMTELLGRSGAVAAIVRGRHGDRDLAAMLGSLRGRVPSLRHIFVLGEGGGAGVVPLELVAGDDRWRRREIDADDPAWIMVTSGSESLPRLVLYSANALVGARGNFLGAFGTDGMRCWACVPQGAAFASDAVSAVLARHGATLILSSSLSPDRLAAGLGERRPTHMLTVPSMLRMLLASTVLPRAGSSSLRVIVLAGERAPAAWLQEAEKRMGCRVVPDYGGADGVQCHPLLDDPPEKFSSTNGRPSPWLADIRVVDAEGHDLGPNQPGEIWARGPVTPMCFVNSPELDARYRTPDGWAKTGDQGVIDSDGYLLVLGRLDDLIGRGARSISASQLEELILTHPGVLHAACVGVPDDVLGERVCACVVPRPGCRPPELAELRELLGEAGIDRDCLPERLEIVAYMPTSATGKILKRRLLELLGVFEPA
jgi:non-ribosomal peptide synthetase component E (peptide arylation enzyme)